MHLFYIVVLLVTQSIIIKEKNCYEKIDSINIE